MDKDESRALTAFLATRRSVKAAMLGEPGPSADEIQTILTIGSRVPDHKKLSPWRLIVFSGGAREKVGEFFAQACLVDDDPEASETRLSTERARLTRAPLVIGLIFSPVDKPGVPEWEQWLSTGAVGLNLCLAANALGYGSQWLTEWVSSSPTVWQSLELAPDERIAGFVYIGTALERLPDRERPDLQRVVTYWPEA